MSDEKPKSSPNLLIILLTLLGVGALQSNLGTAPSPAPGKAEAKPSALSLAAAGRPVATEPSTAEARILRPLTDHFPTAEGEADPLRTAFERTGDDPERGLVFLIATVPDPVQSTNSHRFDEWLGAIQRACESEGFVLDGFRIPWSPDPPPTTASKAAEKSAQVTPPGAVARAAPPAAPGGPAREPGLLLYRSLRPGKVATFPLLAVFLVPETPTLGLDKPALLECLRWAAKWDVRNRGPGGQAEFRILGPSFSGSQRSLERALAAWSRPGGGASSFEIISGSASDIDIPSLRKSIRPADSVDFSATVHTSDALLHSLLNYLGQADGVALMTEGNTGFGLSNLVNNTRVVKGTKRANVIIYPFSSHISKIRGYYDKKGLLKDEDNQAMRSAERLTLPFEEAGDPRDIPGSQTPGFTTAVEELALNQVLADIVRRDIRKVGIIATDPLDVVFLARQVRQFCPDVRLFTTQSHLLFTHPQHVAELRGMLVASTYPLYPLNQLWSYSYRGDTNHSFFVGDAVQGTYNAAVAHLEVIGDPAIHPRFLEYGEPFDSPGAYRPDGKLWAWGEKLRRPPVWLGVVGNHGLYPVKSSAPGSLPSTGPPDDDYVYPHRQSEAEYQSLGLAAPHESGEHGESWLRVRGWFRPPLQKFWLFLFWSLSLACATLAAVNLAVYRWTIPGRDPADVGEMMLGPFPLNSLALFLNCRRAKDSGDDGPCRGPGLLLTAAILLLLMVYLTVSWPLMEVMWSVPWVPINPSYSEFWVALAAYAVVCLMLVSIALSLRAWSVTRGRRRGDARDATPPAAPSRRWSLLAWVCFVAVVFSTVPVAVRMGRAIGVGGGAHSFAPIEDWQRDLLYRLARGVAIPSGVSPVLCMIFLGTAGLVWVYAQLRRRFVFDQHTPRFVATDKPGVGSTGDEATLRSIFDRCERFEEILASPFAMPAEDGRLGWVKGIAATPVGQLLLRNVPVTLVVSLAAGFFIIPVLTRSLGWQGKTPDGTMFQDVAGLMFCVLFGLLTLHTLQLIALWANAGAMMKLVLRLPLTSALDRMPSRVARWFKDPPRPGNNRFDLIRRQARALVDLNEADRESLRSEIQSALKRDIPPDEWRGLFAKLEDLDPKSVGEVRGQIRAIVLDFWRPLPVTAAFADAGGIAPRSGGGDGGVPAELHNIARALSQEPLESHDPTKRLPEWVRRAEDLLALLMMRWLSASVSQIWILIGFLVAGSMAMLLAISSYPFPFQDRLMRGLGLLIVVIVVTTTAIMLGFNRDELISRISNTAPNQFKVDQSLMTGLFTYIVPLLGVFAAISFDASDTIRSLLDPILRHLR